MASSLRTKLRIAYNVVFAPGFWDAIVGRFLWVRGTLQDAQELPTPDRDSPFSSAYKEVRGALHNHSNYSDGLSDIPTVMAAAKEVAVDFVLLADHNTMQPLRDGWQEKYASESPFLLIGTEVTVEDGRFLLALDVPTAYEPEIGVTAQVGIDTIRAANGFPLISLPFDMKHPFEDWSVTGYDGLEVLNFSTIARRHINFLSLPWILYVQHFGGIPAVIQMMATRPDAALARWDSLTRGGKRQVVGIGSLDAHAQMKMFGKKYPIPSYADSFRACQTHIWIPKSADGAERIAAVNTGLRAGRCYFSYDCLADPTGLTFFTTNKQTGKTAIPGEQLIVQPGENLEFTITVPETNALIQLYKDGKVVATSVGGTLSIEREAIPGAYRIEVSLFAGRIGSFFWGVRPWVYSNPIYVCKN